MTHDTHEGRRTVVRFARAGACWGLFAGLVIGAASTGALYQEGSMPFTAWMAVIGALGLAGCVAGYMLAYAASPGGASAAAAGYDCSGRGIDGGGSDGGGNSD